MNAEVCVVGAGPAGAALATRLADLGHDVVIVERERFPRPHVGESLSAAAWPLLDALGVAERVAAAGFTRTVEARVRWRGDEERVRSQGGITVDRAAFDAILLDRARAAGARCITATARRPSRVGAGPPVRGERDGCWDGAPGGGRHGDPGGGPPGERGAGPDDERGCCWEVPIAGSGVLRARFLADASGRRRLLGGRRTPTSPRTLALHALWRDNPPADGAQTRIEALARGWLWGARLPSGGFRTIAFVDPRALAGTTHDRAGLFRELLESSELFADLPTAAMGPVRACDATSYAACDPIGGHVVKVGEAAFAIDPLSSSGVQTAIQTGLAAAAAVHTILAPDGDTAAATAFYDEQQRYAVERHVTSAQAVYAEHREHREADFWRSRAARAPARSSDATPGAAPQSSPGAAPGGAYPSLAELMALRVRLPRAAVLSDTPCLVGDRIEWRRALTHPALDRPVAFLGGDELAPLLDELHAADSLAGAMAAWERRLRPGGGHAVATWLHRRSLLDLAS